MDASLIQIIVAFGLIITPISILLIVNFKDQLKTAYISSIPVFIILLTIGYISYYGWFFSKIMDVDQQLVTAYLSESACERSPLEIETTRYTMKEYMSNFPSITTNHIVHSIFIFICILVLIISYIIQEFKGIDVIVTLIVCILMVWITYSVNDLSNNQVLNDYRKKYDQVKENLTTYFNTKQIRSIAQLPEPFLKRLMVRYRAYHEATNYLSIPIYSDYEIRNNYKNVWTKPLPIKIKVKHVKLK